MREFKTIVSDLYKTGVFVELPFDQHDFARSLNNMTLQPNFLILWSKMEQWQKTSPTKGAVMDDLIAVSFMYYLYIMVEYDLKQLEEWPDKVMEMMFFVYSGGFTVGNGISIVKIENPNITQFRKQNREAGQRQS
jgi:hypothetical protein